MASQRFGRIWMVAPPIGALLMLVVWLVATREGPAPEAAQDQESPAPDSPVAPPVPTPARSPSVAVPVAKPSPAREDEAAAKDPSAQGAVDLFAGEMPDFMVPLHLRVIDKQHLRASEQKELYDYGKEHPDDARPQLLLAWDSMNRDWDGIAVRMYRIAFGADPRVKDDPSMLRDLLGIASTHDRVEFREAAELIKTAYGPAVVPEIEKRVADMQDADDARGVKRLLTLKDQIQAQ